MTDTSSAPCSRFLTLYAEGGLCNRLRVTASAYHFAHTHPSVRVRLLWRVNKECGAEFGDLLQPLPPLPNFRLAPARYRDCPLPRALWEKSGLRKGENLLVRGVNALLALFTHKRLPLSAAALFGLGKEDGNASLDRLLSRSPRLYVATCYQTGPYPPSLPGQLFRPTASLQRQIDALTGKFGAQTVGFHIRRTDHLSARKASPTTAFLEVADHLFSLSPDATLFLATDEEELKNRFLSRYGNRCLTAPCPVSRATKEGMQAALVDLFCLSRTHLIYGSVGSSYSDTAGELTATPVEYVHGS